ncbi:N-terminal phage integrase SAM-like domain-containing protein [Hamadaea flava]|uniref:N-terminal phage integrase SAM-like domain-containing protein n=1 Tax=Hamadaea flava TaxID=1742688 RepID=A0ABV8LLD1_9ACTN|nr:N-terminal phage integrase SAM-like domain-containing protein [Hamadaea flava]
MQATAPHGRRIRLRRGGYASPAAARAAQSAVADRDLHERFGEVATVRDWLYAWLADIEGTIRPTTWQSYRSHIIEYLSPGIGRILLQELTAGKIQELFDALATRVNRYAEPLAPATLQRIRATLRRSLNVAVRERCFSGILWSAWSYLRRAGRDRRCGRTTESRRGAWTGGVPWLACGTSISWPSSSTVWQTIRCTRCGIWPR